MARLDLGAGEAVAGEVAEADDGRAADGAAARPRSAGRALVATTRLKGSPRSRSRAIGAIEAAGRIRASARCRRRGRRRGRPARRRRRQGAGDERRLARRAPGDQPLVLLVDQRLGAVGGRLESPTRDAGARSPTSARLRARISSMALSTAKLTAPSSADDQNDLAGVESLVQKRNCDRRLRDGDAGDDRGADGRREGRSVRLGESRSLSCHASRMQRPPSAVSRYSWIWPRPRSR